MSTAEKAAARRNRILDERTSFLARRSRLPELPHGVADVMVCLAGRQACGLPVAAIEEVLPYRPCVPVPSGPPALIGLYGRAGRAVSVVDLGAALAGNRPAEAAAGGHFIVLRNTMPRLALWVDRADGVARAVPMDGDADASAETPAFTNYARTLPDGRVLALVDLDRLLPTLIPSLSAGA